MKYMKIKNKKLGLQPVTHGTVPLSSCKGRSWQSCTLRSTSGAMEPDSPLARESGRVMRRKRLVKSASCCSQREHLRVGTFNVQSLHVRGGARLRQINVIQDAVRHGIKILALQDTKCRGSDTEEWEP